MRGSIGYRCALAALGSALSLTAAGQQIGRGPAPGGEGIAPAHRAPQPYSRIVTPEGVIVESGGVGVEPIFIEAGQSLGNPADYSNVKEFHDTRPGVWAGEVIHENFLTPLAPGVEDEAGGAILEAPPAIFAFDSIGPNDLDPPDPDIAVGPNHIAVVTNDDFAVYDKCGNELFRQDAEVFFGTPPADLVFDPKVIYDPWNNRWVMLWHVRNFDTDRGRILLSISSGGTPWGVGASYFYDYNVVQDAGTADASWPDYFDLGFSQNFITTSGNMFEFPDVFGNRPFRWARHIIFDKSQIYNQETSFRVSFSNLRNGDNSLAFAPRAVQQQWQFGGLDGIFISSRSAGGDELEIWRLTNAFDTNNLARATISVNQYTNPPDATQPNGGLLDTIGSRLMPAVLTNDLVNGNGLEIFTALTTARNGNAAIRQYRIDATNNNVKTDQDFFLTGWDYWFATPAAGFGGDGYYGFCRTTNAAGGEPEVRYFDLNQGVPGASQQIFDGTGSRNPCSSGGFPSACRWGDYFGAQLDWGDYNANFNEPGRPAKAWFYGEYGRPGTWGTAVGAGSIHSPGTISSVAPSTTTVFSGNEGSVPFDSQVFTLTNNNALPTWIEVIDLPSWATASTSQFELRPSGRNVTISVNTAVANTFCGGTYNGFVRFRNCYSGQTFSRSLRLQVDAPDLNVVSVDAEDGAYFPGETFNVTTVTENLGTAFTSFDLDIYASTNTVISGADVRIGDSSSSVNAGSTVTSSRFVTLPYLIPGTYFIGSIVSEDDGCPQSDSLADPVAITVLECLADTNRDGRLSPNDFNAWILAFNTQSDACDQNGDGECRQNDFNAWILNFNNGCG
ncbi:MAG: GC-type dockerin domain-anchored protein [Planctomycetota bacterium]